MIKCQEAERKTHSGSTLPTLPDQPLIMISLNLTMDIVDQALAKPGYSPTAPQRDIGHADHYLYRIFSVRPSVKP
jgi:hypothetical protein